MVLQSSGEISLRQIATEFGVTGEIRLSKLIANGDANIVIRTTKLNTSVPTSLPLNISHMYGTRRKKEGKVFLYEHEYRGGRSYSVTYNMSSFTSTYNDIFSCVEIFPRTVVCLYNNINYNIGAPSPNRNIVVNNETLYIVNYSQSITYYWNLGNSHMENVISSVKIGTLDDPSTLNSFMLVTTQNFLYNIESAQPGSSRIFDRDFKELLDDWNPVRRFTS